jgi:hypothetical protein
MFVQDFQIVDHPYEDVVSGFSWCGEPMLNGGLHTVCRESERLRDVGPSGWPPAVSETVELHSGLVRTVGDSLIVSFSWQTVQRSLLSSLNADLEIAPFGSEQSLMVVRGQYQPSGGVLGPRTDELVLQRLAESTIRAFLGGVCSSVDRCLVGG